MGMATPRPPPAYAPPPYFCAMPLKQGEEQRTTRTVAATPARNDGGSPPPPPDYNLAASQPPPQQHQQRHSHGELFISDGESSIRSVAERGARAPSSPGENATPRVNWRGFDKPATSSGGRDLATRKCTFKIFVIFRGGWCMSSHALLKGFLELNPAIKRAGGKVVALCSQTPEQVGRMSSDMKLPFQAFGDPSNELVGEMNRRFKMECTVSRNEMVTDAYPHGMAQPCVLAVYGDEAQDEGSVLFKWNRWQTIASMRHADAWAQTMKALSARSQESLGTEAGAIGGGGGGTPRQSSTPLRPNARGVSHAGSGQAPFADHMVGGAAAAAIPAPSTPRVTAETVAAAAAAAAAEKRSPRGYRARTIEEAVDSALAVGWMKEGRNPAASTPRGAAAEGGRAPTPRAPRGIRGANTPRGTPRGALGYASRGGGAFFPEGEVLVAAAGSGGNPNPVGINGPTDGRAREKRFASNPGPQGGRGGRYVEQPGDRRSHPVTPGRKHHRPTPGSRPPVRPPPSAPGGVLPPQHRRPTQQVEVGAAAGGASNTRPTHHRVSISSDSNSSAPPQQQQQQQRKKPAGISGAVSSRRFWFGSSSNMRASFEGAAADFAGGGGGGGAEARGFASAPGGGAAAAGEVSVGGGGGESAVPPAPGRRWGYLRKGGKSPSTPKPVARSK